VPPPALAPLTPREARVAALLRRVLPADAVLVIAAALLGMLARGLVAAYCHQAPVGPEGGTTGAAYCSSVAGVWSWGAFVVTAIVTVGVVRLLCGQRRFARPVALTTVMLALIVNTIIVNSLQAVGP
jgi:hypothetical protein